VAKPGTVNHWPCLFQTLWASIDYLYAAQIPITMSVTIRLTQLSKNPWLSLIRRPLWVKASQSGRLDWPFDCMMNSSSLQSLRPRSCELEGNHLDGQRMRSRPATCISPLLMLESTSLIVTMLLIILALVQLIHAVLNRQRKFAGRSQRACTISSDALKGTWSGFHWKDSKI